MKPLKTSYECNLNSDPILSCVHFTADDTGLHRSGNYGDAELYVTRTTDEDGHVTLSFTDKRQCLVLTRQLNGSDRVDTYYVYDDFDKPLYVLPPLASDALVNDGDYTYSNTAVANYAYCYKYDGLQRCIEKKLPGCDPVYFVYDKAGRPVLTQNAEQRKSSEWAFTKFDAFGQVVLTGTCQLSETADALRTRFKSVAFTEKYDKTGEYGYTNNANLNATSKKILTVNYYDNYDYLTQLIPNSSELDYTDTDTVYNKKYENATYSTISAKGMLTGTRVFMLEESGKEIVTALYYDTDGRLIQSKATNHLGGYEKNYFALSFSGKTLKHKHDHSAYGKANIKEVYTYTYDDADRLLKTYHSLNSATTKELSDNAYDNLSRLQAKYQNDKSQSTYYGYNIRGWLTSISNEYFYQYLTYNKYSNGCTPCYNGNISSVISQITGSSPIGYNFIYDDLNRLKTANFLDYGQPSTKFSESYSYDKHGNIMSLTRNGLVKKSSTYGIIDNLMMIYNGNQLTKVDDAATDPLYSGAFNFVDGNKTSGTEYIYDANGNLTQDKNKGIALIKYNSLNLPSSLQFAYGHTTVRSWIACTV